MNRRLFILANSVELLEFMNKYLPNDVSTDFVIQTDDRLVDRKEEIENFLKQKHINKKLKEAKVYRLTELYPEFCEIIKLSKKLQPTILKYGFINRPVSQVVFTKDKGDQTFFIEDDVILLKNLFEEDFDNHEFAALNIGFYNTPAGDGKFQKKMREVIGKEDYEMKRCYGIGQIFLSHSKHMYKPYKEMLEWDRYQERLVKKQNNYGDTKLAKYGMWVDDEKLFTLMLDYLTLKGEKVDYMSNKRYFVGIGKIDLLEKPWKNYKELTTIHLGGGYKKRIPNILEYEEQVLKKIESDLQKKK